MRSSFNCYPRENINVASQTDLHAANSSSFSVILTGTSFGGRGIFYPEVVDRK